MKNKHCGEVAQQVSSDKKHTKAKGSLAVTPFELKVDSLRIDYRSFITIIKELGGNERNE